MGFRLVQLPLVVLDLVLRMMTPFELIDLAQVSKRSRNFVKLVAKGYRMKLMVNPNQIWIYSEKEYFYVIIHQKVRKSPKNWFRCFNGSNVAIYQKGNYLDTFWDDTDYGIKQMVECLRTVFNRPFYGLIVSLSEQKFRPFTQYFLSLQTSVANLSISCGFLPNEQVVEFLDSIDVTNKLSIPSDFRDDFTYQFKKVPMKTYITGHWFNRENLMSSNWGQLFVDGSNLTNQDLNLFVQKWKTGGLPDLTFVIITSFRMNTLTQIDGHSPPIRNQNKKSSDFKQIRGRAVDVNDGVEVVRNDGVKATLSVLFSNISSTFVVYVRN